MTTILSIDPGGKDKGETGIALGWFSDTDSYELVQTWAVPGAALGFKEWYSSEATKLYPSYIVLCEKFVPRNVLGADYTPMIIEGIVIAYWDNPVFQGASGKNTAVPDEVLKRLGVYTPGGHHRDITEATRHAVWYLKKKQHKPTLLKGWPKHE